ncbi:MAG TPA: ABC transporter permease [Chloroflexota bacterium]|nr:ABC transporter permease [Chloroflexota bacterium]
MTAVTVPASPRVEAMAARRLWAQRGTLLVLLYSAILMLFLIVPLLVVLWRTASSGQLGPYLANDVVVSALRLSILTTTIALTSSVVFGTPLAYLLARGRFPGRGVIDTLVDLPMVLPPAVAGVALLLTFGRRGLLGGWLGALGIEVGFTTAAVVLAEVFVAAPFYVRAAKTGFEGVDRELEYVSGSLGASSLRTFLRVTVPLAMPALLGGAVMTWARALGEFGATIMFAGNFPGTTQTMPLAIYVAMERDLPAALVLASILIVASFVVLLGFKTLARARVSAVP